jgi:hypothetical protein
MVLQDVLAASTKVTLAQTKDEFPQPGDIGELHRPGLQREFSQNAAGQVG